MIPLLYAPLSSGDAYSDRQLTPNFEICAEIFPYDIPKSFPFFCLSVPLGKKSPYLRQYQ